MNEKIRVNNKKSKDKKTNVGVGLVSSNAITLISLVITVVVLIILASVGIYLSLGNNGIFTRAKEAKEATNKQTATEIINLKITNCQINKYAEEQRMPTLKELSLALGADNEIQYVTEQSRKQASTEYDVSSENPSSIYTKLNEYPYEFEINGQLQLASINGVKVATSNPNNENTNWKLWKQKVGCISEEQALDLPENYNELLIELEILDHMFDETYYQVETATNTCYCFTIIKEMLKDYYKAYNLGRGQIGYNCFAGILINKNKVFAPEIMDFGNENIAEQYQLSIYYK